VARPSGIVSAGRAASAGGNPPGRGGKVQRRAHARDG
jgi:hypothetical protein